MAVVKKTAKSYIRCSSCGGNVRKFESYLQGVKPNGKNAARARYCVHCEGVAKQNHPDPVVDDHDDGERHLRQMEDFAAYKAAGAESAYWEDRDAGYCR